jgi:hypothetical protein
MVREIPYHHSHMRMLHPLANDNGYNDNSSFESFAKMFMQWPAFSYEAEGNIICCAGLQILHNEAAEVWSAMRDGFQRYGKSLYFLQKKGIEKIVEERNIIRLQAHVEKNSLTARRYIEHLGFRQEGVCRKYFNRSDYILYARIF